MHRENTPIHTVPKKEIRIILPFLGSSSWTVKNNLIKSLKIVKFCKLAVVFKAGNRMSSFFKFKDPLPKSLRAGVIYQFNCAKCNLSYVGSTWRFWEQRLQEHIHTSALTGKPLKGLQTYAPLQHIRDCSQSPTISRDDFKIIGNERNHYLIRLKESIFIYKIKPVLNNMISSTKLYLFD